MTFVAVVNDGKIALPSDAQLPTGTRVRVETLAEPASPVAHTTSFAEDFREFVGIATDLPSDLARNHDHYLYGTPRR